MKEWIVYCSEKNRQVLGFKSRFNLSFDMAIREINNGDFIIIDSPGGEHLGQKSFLIEISGYPIIVPFRIRNEVIQLITMFPDRRYKHVKI